MARVLRKSKRRREKYGDEIAEHLFEGHCLPCMADPTIHTDAEMKVAWADLRHSLLPEFVRQHPGQRPWAWWAFDAPTPGRRERIDDGVHPFDNPARTLHVASCDGEYLKSVAYELSFGLPRVLIPPFDKGIKYDSYEPEWSFLVRHGLLLPEDSP
jgi:hypothetical protein